MILFMFSAMVAYFLFFIFIYCYCFRSGRIALIRKESNFLTAVNRQEESDPESYFADQVSEKHENKKSDEPVQPEMTNDKDGQDSKPNGELHQDQVAPDITEEDIV